ncbi:HlyD family efflux transporter periplasmic adaptor subunit [Cyanobium sp. ATX 6E8]|uniref:HlyD family secretion protein n=1 Tax=Cyanobium sp. ATX 6E8 TaxID=2823701 RepID=UPI0020CF89AB|nr:HlyD family efflux transporter periplasmic adaptor subunit [Cyanobium sp. ATX 6E8]MCP9943199.1 HlyD family efflux transporter periplasmic adaptor subunit [Cyanobium sp. ATX 6E8]
MANSTRPSSPAQRPALPGRLVHQQGTGIDDLEQEALRLESRPSPKLPLVLAGALSVVTLTVFVAAAVVQVDQIVAVPGKLVTRRSTQALTTPEQGVVKEVFVKEGQRVEAGQPLVVLDPQVQRSDVNELGLQLQAEDSRLASARARVLESIAGLERQEAIDRRVLEPLQRLSAEGGTRMLDVAEKERLLEATRRELAEARRELVTINFESQRTQAQLRADLVGARSKLELVTLRAPVSGTVINLQAQTGQVASGQVPLLKLVPSDELQAQVFAPNRDLAFIRPGQKAEVGFTAYDPTLYGTLPAVVATISEDALPPSPEYDYPHFPITLALEKQVLQSKGQRFALQPGMALNAHIKLQKRTILQLLFSRFNQTLDAVRTVR